MENKQEEENMESVSEGNVVQDPKGEDEMKDSSIVEELTEYDQESQRDDISELFCRITSVISDDMTMTQRQLEVKLIPNQSYEEDKLVDAEMYNDLDLYLAAINGDLDHFKIILYRISSSDSVDDILSSLSPTQNTFLHVAAKHGKLDIVRKWRRVNGKALWDISSHNETEKRNLLRAEMGWEHSLA
ncbi:uncharacterized protein LOC121789597 [Salvia splendens]|uniref:uncharacterized protein LOC121789597 n=1 Tax=Salvia splendens TaxID=180675 RepID=UPI001C262FB7|nr:uncharacterized protein LOC121789597 [Salvia splendens]